MIPREVVSWLAQNRFGELVSQRPVSGGCINNGMILRTASGRSFFLKLNAAPPVDMFAREVAGLEALRVSDGPSVPLPYLHGRTFLLMEDLAPAARGVDYWVSFGHQLAALHKYTNEQFGFGADNYIGSTPQPNPWTEDGFEFFTKQRLLFMACMARERGLLDRGDEARVAALTARLPQLVPQQPPSLIHGDLWSGNALTTADGSPAIIDPAAHYGWAEAELAMTTLFGSFPSEFYRAYEEVRPLEPGYPSRYPIYNLYHLLNHLILFGRGYWGQVDAILRRYG
ncbi:MAG: fructosamine kinase family protein [Anaerolineales bacterium]|nr:fructosamine kinase family protein [Anaerolineales bacterium]